MKCREMPSICSAPMALRHEITPEEIEEGLQPDMLLDEHKMQCCATELVEKNKMRGERDNISVALIRTF